jgi:hypothetical protein
MISDLPIADFQFVRIGNWQLAIGNALLPTGFDDAGNLSLECQFAKTDTAQIKLAQVAAGATTALTASVSTHGKLRFAVRFRNQ